MAVKAVEWGWDWVAVALRQRPDGDPRFPQVVREAGFSSDASLTRQTWPFSLVKLPAALYVKLETQLRL